MLCDKKATERQIRIQKSTGYLQTINSTQPNGIRKVAPRVHQERGGHPTPHHQRQLPGQHERLPRCFLDESSKHPDAPKPVPLPRSSTAAHQLRTAHCVTLSMGEQVMANVFACHGALWRWDKWDGVLWSCHVLSMRCYKCQDRGDSWHGKEARIKPCLLSIELP